MPFVTVTSVGGPHEDGAYLRRLEELALRQLDALEPPAPEPADLLDLLEAADVR
ncbi:hypothetical protein [Nocardia farcinica]|uniref:hypothetical protein n=1 Tax=Nocardia farcinica TaxID=37329 RepID=UPI00245374B5|nr:hypothetical protein [Nocardia farcinica]